MDHGRQADVAREEERDSTMPKPTSRYGTELGGAPTLQPGDTKGAHEYLQRIIRVQEMGGWNSGERSRLAKLRKKWEFRASGQDEYFNTWGNGCQLLKERKQQRIAKKKKLSE